MVCVCVCVRSGTCVCYACVYTLSYLVHSNVTGYRRSNLMKNMTVNIAPQDGNRRHESNYLDPKNVIES